MADAVSTEYMPRGERGTQQTIDKMHRLVALGKLDPTMHKIASWIRLKVPQDKRGNSRALADAIFRFACKHGIFQADPHQVERVEHPIEAMRPVIQARQAGTYRGAGLFVGDCDLFTIYICTLGGILGFPYSFETVKLDPSRPDEYSHIYPALQVQGKWVAYDATRRNPAPDVRPNVPASLIARWEEGEIEKVVGMSGFDDIESEEQQPVGDEFAADYVGSGIPRTFGNGEHDGEIPEVCPGLLSQNIPFTPALPAADVAQDFVPLQKVEHSDPRLGMADVEGKYLPRPIYEDPQSGVNVRHPYDEEWPFRNQVMATEEQKHGRVPGTVPVQVAPQVEGYNLMYASGLGETREELEAAMRDYLAKAELARRAGDSESAVAYQARADEAAGKIASLDEAGGSVMDTVEDVLGDVVKMVPGISEAYIQQMRDRYKQRILDAQTRLAQAEADRLRAQAELTGGVKTPTPWYSNPLVLVGGLVAVGGGIYLMTR